MVQLGVRSRDIGNADIKPLIQILDPCKVVLFALWGYFYRCIDKFVLEICFLGLAPFVIQNSV